MQFPIPRIQWIDIIDIVIVAFLFYQLFLLIKGTRAVQIMQGVAILLLIMFISYHFKLITLYWILHYSLVGIAVALPIVFQPELRRALEQLGRGGVISSAIARLGREEITKLIDEIIWAAAILSQTKTGALIIIEGETGLEDIIERGTKVEAEVSSKLLLSIFNPRSPLHDGAVIIRGKRVTAAGCYLPLSDSPALDEGLGMRHRAGIGITEETDAIATIISEETGKISVAKHGKLSRNLNEENLKKTLVAMCSTSPRMVTETPWWKFCRGKSLWHIGRKEF